MTDDILTMLRELHERVSRLELSEAKRELAEADKLFHVEHSKDEDGRRAT